MDEKAQKAWCEGWITGAAAMLYLCYGDKRETYERLRDEYLKRKAALRARSTHKGER